MARTYKTERSTKTYDTNSGLANGMDPRDLPPGFVSDVNNMTFEQRGIIRTMGKLDSVSGVTATASTDIYRSGMGLFAFGSDKNMPTESISAVGDDGSGKARYTTSTTHGLIAGDFVWHYGFSDSNYNGAKTVTNVSDTTHYDVSADTYTATGTGTAVTMYGASNTFTRYIAIGGQTYPLYLINTTLDKTIVGMVPAYGAVYQPVFYYADGALRIYDAGFSLYDTDKLYAYWFGYIKRTHFYGITGYEAVYDKWYGKPARIAPPTRGIVLANLYGTCDGTDANTLNATVADAFPAATGAEFTAAAANSENYIAVSADENKAVAIRTYTDTDELETDNITDWTGDTYKIFPYSGTGFNFLIVPDGSGGSWTAGTWEFAITFIYDGIQESLPYIMTGTVTTVASDTVNVYINAAGPYNPRITGGNLYCRKQYAGEPWKVLCNIDLMRGAKLPEHVEYSAWVGEDTSSSASSDLIGVFLTGPLVTSKEEPYISYDAVNGFPGYTTSLDASCKDVDVVNRRAFGIGIMQPNDIGGYTYYGDRIAYTPVNRFDTWPTDFHVDIARDDGDEFTAIKGFGDRVLAFKNRILYTVNITQGVDTAWYIEGEYVDMGVSHKAHVFKSMDGVVWANEYGCYFFDGKQVINLHERQIDGATVRIIDQETWESFFTQYAIVGIDPRKQQVIVVGDAHATAGTVYIFDMNTGAWTKGDRFSQATNHFYTNFAVHSGELITGSYSD